MDGRRPRQWNDYRGGSIAASTGSDDVSRIRVNGALKMLDHGDGCISAKREYLHHDYRARFSGRVNPEKGVVDTSPRQGAAGTTAFDRLQPLLMRHLPCSRLVVECGRAWTALTSSQLRPQERRYPP
jgi:hypothetical protein